MEQDTLVHAWHNQWPTTMFNDDDEQSDEFQGFRVTGGKKMIADHLTYEKGTPSDVINKLEEIDIEEVLNNYYEAPVVHSMADNEIAEMVLNHGDRDDNIEDEDDNKEQRTEKGILLMPIYLTILILQLVRWKKELMWDMDVETVIQRHEGSY
ncbi:hypothetical protein scyTo_0016017 [Scyliorhinus torazame]|uniref:Uncharacterized protein n=1 Tax=Scyliorhinus torazame TaxID=75743 RepID=A0A401Q2Q8_SCYTO|nr:hypothetical protein [Scyliorhinus torazame]